MNNNNKKVFFDSFTNLIMRSVSEVIRRTIPTDPSKQKQIYSLTEITEHTADYFMFTETDPINEFVSSHMNKSLFDVYFDIIINNDNQQPNTDIVPITHYLTEQVSSLVISITNYCLTHHTAVFNSMNTTQINDIYQQIGDAVLQLFIRCKYALDIKSMTTYFECITQYAVNLVQDTIFNCDYKKDERGYTGQSLPTWKNGNLQNYMFSKVIKEDTTDGKTDYICTYNVKAQRHIFNSEFCNFFRRYTNGTIYKPRNLCTPYSDPRDSFITRDAFNFYRPPFEHVKPLTDFNQRCEKQFNRFLEVLAVCCNYQQEYIDFMLEYIANITQKPYEQVPYIIILCSEVTGIGKTSIIVETIKHCVGSNNCVDIADDFSNICGSFNEDIATTVFQHKDEIRIYANGSNELVTNIESLKKLSTANTVHVANKNVKGYDATSYMHLFLCTNNKGVFVPQNDERRQVLIEGATNATKFHRHNQKLDADYNSEQEYLDNVIAPYFSELYDTKFASEFWYYVFCFFTQRKINQRFASAYKSYAMIRETNRRYRQQSYTTKADVVLDALRQMCEDLLSDSDSSISLQFTLKQELTQVLKEINLQREYSGKGDNRYNVQYHIDKITQSYCKTSDFKILNIYIRNVLATNPTLFDIDEFRTSFISRGVPLSSPQMLSPYLYDFTVRYPALMHVSKLTRGTKTFNKYKLSADFKAIIENE